MRAKRDYAMLAMLFGCGFRRSELVGLELDEIQMRQGHWAAVDLIGEEIQFLLGHASVQTTERYLGCKQNLGHPVNDLFDLRMDGRPHEHDGESATAKSADPVEKASRRGVECRHGGSDHEQPVCDSTKLSPPERSDLVEVRKGPRAESLRRCLGARASRGYSGSKEVANQIQQSSDLWDLEHYLTERRKEINRKYDFRGSRLVDVLGRLLYENRLGEGDLRGLREEKMKSIRSFAQFLRDEAA